MSEPQATAETTTDDGQFLRKAVNIAMYLGGKDIRESWASQTFKTTYHKATRLAGLDSPGAGVHIEWDPKLPQFLNVVDTGVSVPKYDSRPVAVEGVLAQALFFELEALAKRKAKEDIKAERERQLDIQAAERVAMIAGNRLVGNAIAQGLLYA